MESILPKDLNVTALAVGPHLVGVRYQDNNNTWGEVLIKPFMLVMPIHPMVDQAVVVVLGGSSAGFFHHSGSGIFCRH